MTDETPVRRRRKYATGLGHDLLPRCICFNKRVAPRLEAFLDEHPKIAAHRHVRKRMYGSGAGIASESSRKSIVGLAPSVRRNSGVHAGQPPHRATTSAMLGGCVWHAHPGSMGQDEPHWL